MSLSRQDAYKFEGDNLLVSLIASAVDNAIGCRLPVSFVATRVRFILSTSQKSDKSGRCILSVTAQVDPCHSSSPVKHFESARI